MSTGNALPATPTIAQISFTIFTRAGIFWNELQGKENSWCTRADMMVLDIDFATNHKTLIREVKSVQFTLKLAAETLSYRNDVAHS
ncbi:hypothetical protein Plhal304r1_c040g0117721 [Plasmopara halstedii]